MTDWISHMFTGDKTEISFSSFDAQLKLIEVKSTKQIETYTL